MLLVAPIMWATSCSSSSSPAGRHELPGDGLDKGGETVGGQEVTFDVPADGGGFDAAKLELNDTTPGLTDILECVSEAGSDGHVDAVELLADEKGFETETDGSETDTPADKVPDTPAEVGVDDIKAEEVCSPYCEGKECGDDGCGGSCGECEADYDCQDGICVYVPYCGDGVCNDPQGENCESCVDDCACDDGSICFEQACCLPLDCDTADKQCGAWPDGCGGTLLCGGCGAPPLVCVGGACVCLPSCGGKECGEDGCGGSCGECPVEEICYASGICGPCEPACQGKECGEDGCGGSCGECPVGQACGPAGDCAPCNADCEGKNCGTDGCGGSCGECTGICCGDCSPAGKCVPCVCEPDCAGKECGWGECECPFGVMSGWCGGCAEGFVCEEGACVVAPPPPPPPPAITISDPTPLQAYNADGDSTSITVIFEFENWGPWPGPGKSVRCLVDGVVDGSTNQGASYTFSEVPFGMHTLTCQLLDGGMDVGTCDAMASVSVRVRKPCTESEECDDDNPCSIDACIDGEGEKRCNYGPGPGDCCCTSIFDCMCSGSGNLGLCHPETHSCGGCLTDAHCDDPSPCTIDKCVGCGQCTNTWVSCE